MNFEKLINNRSAIKIAIIIGIIGVLIIFLSDFIKLFDSTETAKTSEISSEDYADALSQDIKELVISITGDTDVKVIVTLESGTEYIYATETNVNTDVVENRDSNENYNNQTSDKTEESYIIINTGSGEQPLLLTTIAPSVRGVAVVCNSGGNSAVAEKIISAIGVLLDIKESKISVSGRF